MVMHDKMVKKIARIDYHDKLVKKNETKHVESVKIF